jgi:tetratricopeptide (TPR) repeat protein
MRIAVITVLIGCVSLLCSPFICSPVMALTQDDVQRYSDRVKTDIFQTEVEVLRSGSSKANTLLAAAKSKYNSGYSSMQQGNLNQAQSLFDSAMSYSSQAKEAARQRVAVEAALSRMQNTISNLRADQIKYGDTVTAQLLSQTETLLTSATQAFSSENYTGAATYVSNFDTKSSDTASALRENRKVKTRLDKAQRRYQKDLETHHRQRLATEPLSERYLNEALGLVNHATNMVNSGDFSKAMVYLDRAENSMERFEDHHRETMDQIDGMRYRNRRVKGVIESTEDNLRLMNAQRAESMNISARNRYGRIGNNLSEHDYDRAELHMMSAEERARRALARSKSLMGDKREILAVLENTNKFLERVRTALEMSREALLEYQQQGIFDAFSKVREMADNGEYLLDEGKSREALAEFLVAEENARTIFLDLQKIVRLIKAEKEMESTKQAQLLEDLKKEISDVSELMSSAFAAVKRERLQVMKDRYGEAVVEFRKGQKFFETGKFVISMTHVRRAREKLIRVLELDPSSKNGSRR